MRTKKELEQIAGKFMVISVKGYGHIISDPMNGKNKGIYPDPNYMDSGRALIGILIKGQSLSEFKESWILRNLSKR